jgi:hypothetical protein
MAASLWAFYNAARKHLADGTSEDTRVATADVSTTVTHWQAA